MQTATSNFHVRLMKKLLFIISTPPYSAKRGAALLDAAMVAAAFDAEVSLMFRGDGIWSLLPNQSAEAIEQRSFSKMSTALADYEIDRIYVCLDSLVSRGVKHHDFVSVQGLNLAEQQKLIANQDAVIGAAP